MSCLPSLVILSFFLLLFWFGFGFFVVFLVIVSEMEETILLKMVEILLFNCAVVKELRLKNLILQSVFPLPGSKLACKFSV